MTVQRASTADLDWIVDLLNTRRAPLVEHAPVFWHPAPDARDKHREFLDYLLTEGGGKAYRTQDALLVTAPRRDGWLVDDAYIPQWSKNNAGKDLWNAFASDAPGKSVRFVCPVYEHERTEYASSLGLTLQESWWLKELASSGGEPGQQIELPGADGITVGAPPVYAPGGPILFLPAPQDARAAAPAALEKAIEIGCAAVVVNQQVGDDELAEALSGAGFRRHCDYLSGTVQPI